MTKLRTPITYEIPDGSPKKSCMSCGKLITFVLTKNGKPMPVEYDGEHRGEPHFAYCPNAAKHRKPRPKRNP